VFAKAQITPNVANVIASAAESKRIIEVGNARDEITETSDEIGGNIVFSIGYANAAATAAVMSVNKGTKKLTTAITGVAGADFNISLLQYATLKSLADYINSFSGYSVSVPSAYQNSNPMILDEVSALGILSLDDSLIGIAGRVKNDKKSVEDFFALSSIVSADINVEAGLPVVQAKTFFTGGTVGATSGADVLAALTEFEKVRINTVVPLFSRDASLDINESKTDAASSYTIDSIHAAVKSHCILMSNTKNKSERHCVLSFRGSYTDAKLKTAAISSYRAQLVFQDVRALSTDGNLKWMQPWALAAEVAGMRSGAIMGLPLTFKFFNVSGIRQTASILDEIPEDVVIDFEPRTQYDEAIDKGLTFLEAPSSGGFRVIVDNTTYTRDDNWVFNRMATLHASDVIAYDFRLRLENAIVGARNTDWSVASIRSFCESILSGYKGQGLLGSATDAANGFKDLSIRLEGNTVYVDVAVILVEGIDFVLETITLKRNTAAA
jgi:hypothetical protein